MTGPPWLSVVMPAYNGERYVSEALESVRREGTEGVEVVVVDDGSSDGTREIVRRFARELPLRLLEPGRTGNWVAASNVGLRAARGRYACFLHQDDVWRPGRLSALRAHIRARGPFRLLVHPAEFVSASGRVVGTWRCPLRGETVSPERFVEALLVQNFLAIPSPVFDREAALEGGGLNESLWYTADWDLWLRLGATEPTRFLREPLAAFRIHDESQTVARPRSAPEFLAQMTRVLERHLATWPVRGARRRRLERVARFSAAMNCALATRVRDGAPLPVLRLALAFGALGPAGWRTYLRDSRIVDRVVPRLRLRLARSGHRPSPGGVGPRSLE